MGRDRGGLSEGQGGVIRRIRKASPPRAPSGANKQIWPIFHMPCSNYLNYISCSGKQQKGTFVSRALSVADTPERTDFTNVAILKYLPSSS